MSYIYEKDDPLYTTLQHDSIPYQTVPKKIKHYIYRYISPIVLYKNCTVY